LAAPEAWIEEPLIVFEFEVMELHPEARDVECIDVCREAAVGLVDIVADVLHVTHRLRLMAIF
jgi:hypothetical protein